MAVVALAGVKGFVSNILPDIGFERPVLLSPQIKGRAAFSQRGNVIIDQVGIVTRCPGVDE